MRRQPLFMKLKNREREQRNQTSFRLEFNDDNFAVATPEFWDAWRADMSQLRGRTISRQYAPAKYTADQIGQQGKKPIWVVFSSWSAKEAFDAKLAKGNTSAPETPADPTIKGLGWSAKTANTGMFFDDRNPKKRGVLVAWLNYNRGVYSVNVVSDTFQLTRPIPRSISDLGDAVDWVYQNAAWGKS